MKHVFLVLVLLLALPLLASDKSSSYQVGTYVSNNVVADGTTTNNITCGSGPSTVCNGGIRVNGVTVYQIKVADGVWHLETYRQASDSTTRRTLGFEAPHFKTEKPNPLDALKNGDRVMFRVEQHQKLNGKETDIYIPYADNPNKEVKFVGHFTPNVSPAVAAKPTDNVKAMCDAHKLSPEAEKQFCQPPAAALTDEQKQAIKEQVKQNSDAAKSSPAAAAAIALEGHQLTPQELAERVKEGKASRCGLVSIPPGAEVYIDGNRAGVTPMGIVLSKRDTPRTITFKLDGYKAAEKQIDPDGKNMPIVVTLEKLP